ncbi:hypothetical protein Pfo_025710 [Paulownia fortunei]|nr:hypothetical protein Pfo_025710 [Paulownia fortunei]
MEYYLRSEMEPINVQKLKYKKLVSYTDNFCESNYIGLYLNFRGTRYMMVKIWEVPLIYNYKPGDNQLRLMEIILLRHEMLINHPGMVKLYGYCCEGEHLGVVYEFKPFDLVFNLIPKDGFTWLQRIEAAFGLASLLKFLHAGFYKPFIVQNLDAAHIVLDELCDFGLISGGIFPDRRTYSGHHVIGCYGYIDIGASSKGHCSNKQDVFAFGVILLSLISQRVYTEEDRQAGVPFVYKWALRESEAFESDSDMENTQFSLVHKSQAAESDFCPADGHKITMLALECVNGVEYARPTMKQVVRSLLKLEVVKQHADFLGVNKLLHPCENGR